MTKTATGGNFCTRLCALWKQAGEHSHGIPRYSVRCPIGSWGPLGAQRRQGNLRHVSLVVVLLGSYQVRMETSCTSSHWQVASSSSPPYSQDIERNQERKEHPGPHAPRHVHPSALASSSSPPSPPAPTGVRDGNRFAHTDKTKKSAAHEEGRVPYQLPQYRHNAPWPRPRPSAEAAAKARAARRARAERGASTAADSRAEMEDKVCSTWLCHFRCCVYQEILLCSDATTSMS